MDRERERERANLTRQLRVSPLESVCTRHNVSANETETKAEETPELYGQEANLIIVFRMNRASHVSHGHLHDRYQDRGERRLMKV